MVMVACSKTNTSNQHSRVQHSIWWRQNSFYNEAYVKMLKRRLEIKKKLEEIEHKQRNELLIEKLLSLAKNTINNARNDQ
jgi:hypothetical protein